MGFMQSYKHLDNLCKEMNGIGISGYIRDMESAANGSVFVSNWKNDYVHLKHYRHIRNKIAHETYADENTLCFPEDSEWLDEFYQRILAQQDPLAVYYNVNQRTSASFYRDTKPISTIQSVIKPSIPKPSQNIFHLFCLAVMAVAGIYLLVIIYAMIFV